MQYYVHKTNNITEALSFNMPIVFESFGPDAKCFVYHPTATDWPKALEWHDRRNTKWVIAFCEVREISHPSHFINTPTYDYVDWWIELGVDPTRILFIGNHHSMLDELKLRMILEKPIRCEFVRYFEADAFFRHTETVLAQNYHQGPDSQSLEDLTNHKKKYLALFGKPRKFMRSGALLKMHDRGMSQDAIISCLAEGEGVRQTIDSAAKFWKRSDLERVIPLYQGPADDISYDAPETDDSNYRGYPYDPNLYKDTAISIVAETNDVGDPEIHTINQFWVTEKTCRTIYNLHPFVVLSTKDFLQGLREMGYRTFNSVIDESYDEQEDPEARLDMALDAAVELAALVDHPDVKDVCVHNYQVMNQVACLMEDQLLQRICHMATIKY